MSKRKRTTGSNQHQRLYDQLPKFQCKPGCTDCCGPVPFTAWEWSRVRDKRTLAVEDNLRCPYSREGNCAIYDERPFMCRLFGVAEDLRCPHGCRPNGLLPAEKSKALLDSYIQIMK